MQFRLRIDDDTCWIIEVLTSLTNSNDNVFPLLAPVCPITPARVAEITARHICPFHQCNACTRVRQDLK